MTEQNPTRATILAALMLALFAVLAGQIFAPAARSSDLLATWLAAVFLDQGLTDRIYLAAEPHFTMQVHPAWLDHMREVYGYGDAVFPYLYPPLWAWAATQLLGFDFFALERGATFLNAALLAGCVWLAIRLARGAVHPLLHATLALMILMGSQIGTVALFENQPQILVSFLILLALERASFGAPRAAGAAIALAAAIKLYPAVLALLWLATGDRRAFGWFLGIGAALGALSVAVTGWPLHMAFLDTVANVSASVLVNPVNWNLHALLANLGIGGELSHVTPQFLDPEAADGRGWKLLVKPSGWALATTVAPFALLAVVWRSFRNAPPRIRDHAFWPLALVAMGLIAPIGWAYHYIAPVALAPLLLRRRSGWLWLALVALPISYPVLDLLNGMGMTARGVQILGTVPMMVLALAFGLQARWLSETDHAQSAT